MELFKLFGTIAIDNSGANKGIDETTDKAEKSHPKISAAFEKIGSAAVKVGKVMATGLAAGAAAVGALAKQSLDSYAEYEQLVGGVETLFKESGNKVLEYANNAYKTAGMSANEYMETVTSFSASLLQSLDGDTNKATEAANRAITDMSDNANKMGTSMESIQNAYQGFAKQNYTMLDNLKLGYGGTKEEMERLLKDAEKLTKKKYDLSSFADIVDAIHAIQVEMEISGLTMEEAAEMVEQGLMSEEEAFKAMGTTAKEASSTIQGSLTAAKSAWSNLLVGMADDNADFEELIDSFVVSVDTAVQNILPRVEIALEGAGKLIDKLVPVIIDKIPAIINDALPNIVRSAASIVKSLVDGISKNQDTITDTAFDVIMIIVQTITNLLPQIFDLGVDLLLTVAQGIVDNLDELISSAIAMIEKIIDTITDPDTLETLLDAAIEIIIAIAEGMIEFLPKLTDATINIITKIVDVLTDEENLSALLDAALELILALADGLIECVTELAEAAVEIIVKLVEFLLEEENLKKIIDAAVELIETLVTAIIENVGLLAEAGVEITTALVTAIFETDWIEIGKAIIKGIGQGLINGWENMLENHSFSADLLTKVGTALQAGGIGDSLVGTVNYSSYPVAGQTNTKAAVNQSGTSRTTVSNQRGAGRSILTQNALPSHADGLNYVPYDGYIAELHKGEMVVPADASRSIRSGALDANNEEVVNLLQNILYALQERENQNISLSINNREFARMVKAVN